MDQVLAKVLEVIDMPEEAFNENVEHIAKTEEG